MSAPLSTDLRNKHGVSSKRHRPQWAFNSVRDIHGAMRLGLGAPTAIQRFLARRLLHVDQNAWQPGNRWQAMQFNGYTWDVALNSANRCQIFRPRAAIVRDARGARKQIEQVISSQPRGL